MLNTNQQIAALHYKGPMMVLAGPGSGKTTVIAHRVFNLITKYNVSPSEILVITYTKAAALEMENRFFALSIPVNDSDYRHNSEYNRVTFSTFHSLFFRILRRAYNYTHENILGAEEAKELLRRVVDVLALEPEDAINFIKHLQEEMSLAKNEMLTLPELKVKCCEKNVFLKIATEYANAKRQIDKIDFDDMQTMCFKLLSSDSKTLSYWSEKFKYILIDEFQDINNAQFKCMCLLSLKYRNIFIVGDDDQSIYKFRGARPDFLLNFHNEFPEYKSILLDTNYRSTDNIIYFAKSAISNNKKRFNKDFKGMKGIGDGITLIQNIDLTDEALTASKKIKELVERDKLQYSDIAIVYRVNIQARPFVEFFNDFNIPYILKDELPDIYSHWICKDLCAYIELAVKVDNGKALKRIINKPARYMSKTIVSDLDKISEDGISYMLSQQTLEKWQLTRLEELRFFVSSIKKRSPHEAIRYIRKAIGYDDYIKEYALYKKIDSSDLFDVLNDLTDASKKQNSLIEYLDFVQKAQLEKMKRKKNEKIENAVTLSTIHSVKGMEFEAVLICSVIDGILPYSHQKGRPDLEEERRLFYVAITRAKRHLFISTLQSRHDVKATPSQFIQEIRDAGKRR